MFDIQVIKKVAVIAEGRNGKTLELNRATINGGPEQWDLRRWQRDPETGEKRMMKGICLQDNEMDELKKILCDL